MCQTHGMEFFPGFLLLLSCFVSAKATCSVTNMYKSEGTSVTLNMDHNYTAAANIRVVEWFSNELIMWYYPSEKMVVAPSYNGRVNFDIRTFSLELMNLQKNDSGIYLAEITEKKTICAAKYNLSVMELVIDPVLTVVSNWSGSNSCNVTVTCRVHTLSLTFSCNSSDCTQLGDLPITPTLVVFARDCYIICNHSNQVSWRTDSLDMSSHCECAKGKDSTPWIPLTIGLMSLIVAVCVMYNCRKIANKKCKGTDANDYAGVMNNVTQTTTAPCHL